MHANRKSRANRDLPGMHRARLTGMDAEEALMANPVVSDPTRPQEGIQWSWCLHARCRVVDPHLFFASDGEHKGPRIRREREAKRICGHCPVITECRS
ncbi:WhiB family transcriptional regulator [Rhodococcus opacus]|jgi:hypothetical protein|uniref:WhiB family transcriptional regulator n=2 Tax=Rhodococcus opacus TaxID=37919 RepID=UPI0026A5C828|nr:WhiB family transcriptional regulator [Rhodococcus opacus]